MNWIVILTAVIIVAIFAVPFILVSRKKSSDLNPDGSDENNKPDQPMRQRSKTK